MNRNVGGCAYFMSFYRETFAKPFSSMQLLEFYGKTWENLNFKLFIKDY